MSLTKHEVANRYAKALYATLEEQDQVATGQTDLATIQSILTADPTVTTALASTALSPDQKEALLKPLLESVTTQPVKNLVQMMFDYGRISDLQAVIDKFKQIYNQKHGIVIASVTTAVPLAPEQRDQLAQTFANKVQANQVELQEHTNPALIGGVILQAENVVFDGSIKTKLDNLKRLLLQ
ncbi:ATP synthase F1 subunit delta [Fructilactobacillus ixorae]|uniref:ATP synthase subunit delta n=1 Tax=Fructilactobacillus ixorae TaxID=1750535 RepID=A0ABY5C5Q5_9LACO|nr:ATP synthase F1 subunit delta [Fructilactobacillus ixorae]USS93722.1 ATP synthase F1 subunit delta [Fructilactobacillus ixorae]